jgi:hypothetical protein
MRSREAHHAQKALQKYCIFFSFSHALFFLTHGMVAKHQIMPIFAPQKANV